MRLEIGVMLSYGCLQRATQVRNWIATSPPRSNRISKNLPTRLHHALSHIQRARFFDNPQNFQNICCGNVSNRPMAQLVENVAFKSAKNIESVMRRPLVTVSFMPFAGNRLKIVYGIDGSNALGIALRLAGVVTCRQRLSRL